MTIEPTDDGIKAELVVPPVPRGVILLIDGDWREATRQRTNDLAERFADAQYATCVIAHTPRRGIALVSTNQRDDTAMLADRIILAAEAIRRERDIGRFPIGYLASGLACASAMLAAATTPGLVRAVVSDSGRPDIAGVKLHRIEAPSLFLIPSDDHDLYEMNRWASRRIGCATRLDVIDPRFGDIAGSTDLNQVFKRASRWFESYFAARQARTGTRHFIGLPVPFSRTNGQTQQSASI